jgi:hypothetical protein
MTCVQLFGFAAIVALHYFDFVQICYTDDWTEPKTLIAVLRWWKPPESTTVFMSLNFFVRDSRLNCIEEGWMEHVTQNLLRNKKFESWNLTPQSANFNVQNALKLTYNHPEIPNIFLGSLSLAIIGRRKEGRGVEGRDCSCKLGPGPPTNLIRRWELRFQLPPMTYKLALLPPWCVKLLVLGSCDSSSKNLEVYVQNVIREKRTEGADSAPVRPSVNLARNFRASRRCRPVFL